MTENMVWDDKEWVEIENKKHSLQGGSTRRGTRGWSSVTRRSDMERPTVLCAVLRSGTDRGAVWFRRTQPHRRDWTVSAVSGEQCSSMVAI
jgi:hypothetical protein